MFLHEFGLGLVVGYSDGVITEFIWEFVSSEKHWASCCALVSTKVDDDVLTSVLTVVFSWV